MEREPGWVGERTLGLRAEQGSEESGTGTQHEERRGWGAAAAASASSEYPLSRRR